MPTKKFKVKLILKKELSKSIKYKTTYKDIDKYFKMINTVVFKDKLSPFNDIKIKRINKDKSNNKPTWGQVVVWEWKRKGTRVFHLEMLPEYPTKKDFVDTLGHEMVHLYQMANLGDTGNHNKLFYSYKPKLNEIGLTL
ncbi:MAG: SprT-like family protein [Pelagibacterales bacterium]|nr:SprT-like family protein [Pelagibacterales bacterium]